MTPRGAELHVRKHSSQFRRLWSRIYGPKRRTHLGTPVLFYVMVTLVVALGAFNSQNNLLFWMLGFLLAVMIVSGIVSGRMLMGVSARRRPSRRAHAGQVISLSYQIECTSRITSGYALSIRERWGRDHVRQRRLSLRRGSKRDIRRNRAVAEVIQPGFAMHAGPDAVTECASRIRCVRRGVVRLGSIRVETSFPFGLLKKSIEIDDPGELVIAPRIVELPAHLISKIGSESVVAAAGTQRTGAGDEFHSLREYVPGDSIRLVAWRAWAKRAAIGDGDGSVATGADQEPNLLVRQTALPSPNRIWIVVLLEKGSEEDQESALSAAASVATTLSRRSCLFGLSIPATGFFIKPGAGSGQLDRVMDGLARVDLTIAADSRTSFAGAGAGVPRAARAPGVTRVEIYAGDVPTDEPTRRESSRVIRLPSHVVHDARELSQVADVRQQKLNIGEGVDPDAKSASDSRDGMRWAGRRLSLLYVSTFLAVMSYCLAEGHLMLGVLAAAAIGGAWIAQRREKPFVLRRSLVNGMLLVVIAYAVWSALSTPPGQEVISRLGEFLAVVLLIKLFDRRQRRDDTQIFMLSGSVAITAILTSNALGVGVLVLMYMPVAIVTAMVEQLRSPLQGEKSPFDATDAARDRIADKRFSRLVGGLIAAISVLSAAVFVTAPRGIGENYFGTIGHIQQAVIGFSENVKLGESGLLSEVRTPIFQLRLTDINGNNLGGIESLRYLRGMTRNRYDAFRRTWVSSSHGANISGSGQDLIRDEVYGLGSGEARMFARTKQQVTFHHGTNYSKPMNLFTEWRPVAIKFDSDCVLHVDSSDQTLRASVPGRLSYTVESTALLEAGTDDSSISSLSIEQQAAEYLDATTMRGFIPPGMDSRGFRWWEFGKAAWAMDLGGSERLVDQAIRDVVYAIALRVLAEHSISPNFDRRDPSQVRQACLAVRDYFQRDFEYTLDLPAPPSETDPLLWFLTASKRGHCEYFASAMTVMLQSLGVQARFVSGYVAGEYNSVTGEYVVRQSDAHAWVEACVGDGRWQVFDPTPSSVMSKTHQSPTSLFGRLKQWYDLLEVNWSSAIIGFDKFKQNKLLSGWNDIRDFFSQGQVWLASMQRRIIESLPIEELGIEHPPAYLPLLPIVVLVFVWLGSVALKTWRRSTRHSLSQFEHDAELQGLLTQVSFYPEALERLIRLGLSKPEGRTLLEHAQRLGKAGSELSDPLKVIAQAFYRVRFGRVSLTSEQEREALAALDMIPKALTK